MAAWTPADLAVPPKIWIDSDAAVWSGSNLASISAKGADAGAMTLTGTPVKGTALNSHDVIRFSGSGKYLTRTLSAWGAGGKAFAFTVFKSLTAGSGPAVSGLFSQASGASSSAGIGFLLLDSYGPSWYSSGWATGPFIEDYSGANATDRWGTSIGHIAGFKLGSTIGEWIDGTAHTPDGSSTTGAFPNVSSQAWNFGKSWDGDGSVDLAQLMLFDYDLTTTDRQKLEGWAAWTFGLVSNLPIDHPYKSAAPEQDDTGPGDDLWTPADAETFTTAWRFDADAITGVTNGDPLSTWPDLGGGSHNLTAAGADRPLYEATAFNGFPAVRFSNSRMLMSTTTPVVSQISAYDNTASGIQINPAGVANNTITGDPEITVKPYETDDIFVFAVSWDSSGYKARFNGAEVKTGNWSGVPSPPAAAGTAWVVGNLSTQGPNNYGRFVSDEGLTNQLMFGDRDAGSRTLDGDVVYIGAGAGKASDDELAMIEGWALWKTGNQALLPIDHPYHDAYPTSGSTPPPPATPPEWIVNGAQGNGAGNITVPAPPKYAAGVTPVGYMDGDFFLMEVQSDNEAVTAPTGWLSASTPQGTGTAAAVGSTRLTQFYKFASGTLTAPTVTDSGNHTLAHIMVFRGVDPDDPFNAVAGDVLAVASASVTCPAVTTDRDNCLIVCTAANATDNTTLQGSSYANANLTGLAEILDFNTNQNNGGGYSACAGVLPTAGSSGTTTFTLATSSKQARITLALNPIPTVDVETGTLASTATAAFAPIGKIKAHGRLVASAAGVFAPAARARITGILSVAAAAAFAPAGKARAAGTLVITGAAAAAFTGLARSVGTMVSAVSSAATFSASARVRSSWTVDAGATTAFLARSRATGTLVAATAAATSFLGSRRVFGTLSIDASSEADFVAVAKIRGVLAAVGSVTTDFRASSRVKAILGAEAGATVAFVGQAVARGVLAATVETEFAAIGSSISHGTGVMLAEVSTEFLAVGRARATTTVAAAAAATFSPAGRARAVATFAIAASTTFAPAGRARAVAELDSAGAAAATFLGSATATGRLSIEAGVVTALLARSAAFGTLLAAGVAEFVVQGRARATGRLEAAVTTDFTAPARIRAVGRLDAAGLVTTAFTARATATAAFAINSHASFSPLGAGTTVFHGDLNAAITTSFDAAAFARAFGALLAPVAVAFSPLARARAFATLEVTAGAAAAFTGRAKAPGELAAGAVVEFAPRARARAVAVMSASAGVDAAFIGSGISEGRGQLAVTVTTTAAFAAMALALAACSSTTSITPAFRGKAIAKATMSAGLGSSTTFLAQARAVGTLNADTAVVFAPIGQHLQGAGFRIESVTAFVPVGRARATARMAAGGASSFLPVGVAKIQGRLQASVATTFLPRAAARYRGVLSTAGVSATDFRAYAAIRARLASSAALDAEFVGRARARARLEAAATTSFDAVGDSNNPRRFGVLSISATVAPDLRAFARARGTWSTTATGTVVFRSYIKADAVAPAPERTSRSEPDLRITRSWPDLRVTYSACIGDHEMRDVIDTRLKRVGEVLDYTHDWSPRMWPGDRIITASTTVLSGGAQQNGSFILEDQERNIRTQHWISGGTAGEFALTQIKAVTEGGRTMEEVLRTKILS